VRFLNWVTSIEIVHKNEPQGVPGSVIGWTDCGMGSLGYTLCTIAVDATPVEATN
jgi:hypothetical protein